MTVLPDSTMNMLLSFPCPVSRAIVLKFYDMAACFEGFAIGPRPSPAVGYGWEANTGVLAVRRSALPLLHQWLQYFKSEQDRLTQYLSGEQQGTVCCSCMSWWRL